ncbi:hydrogenase maturation protease [Kaarinaea lacus]
MRRIIVVGVGSPFGDDSLGWDVVRQLRLHPKIQQLSAQEVVIQCADRPGIDLLNIINQAHTALIIDAAVSDFPPGTITRLENDEIDTILQSTSTHDFGVLETIALGKALNQLPQRVIILGITIGQENIEQNEFGQTKIALSAGHMSHFINIIIEELGNLLPKEMSYDV